VDAGGGTPAGTPPGKGAGPPRERQLAHLLLHTAPQPLVATVIRRRNGDILTRLQWGDGPELPLGMGQVRALRELLDKCAQAMVEAEAL
jgi:hypothetical protein